jgi:hypothetical protein
VRSLKLIRINKRKNNNALKKIRLFLNLLSENMLLSMIKSYQDQNNTTCHLHIKTSNRVILKYKKA